MGGEIGALVTITTAGGLVVGTIVDPYLSLGSHLQCPNGLLALALSLFPFSAPVTMLMRMTTTSVPAWQLTASLALLVLTAVGMVWLMARLFRVQTLLSGESFSIRRFWKALQG